MILDGLSGFGGQPLDIFNLLALITYILIKELILDKKNLRKELHDIQFKKDPLKALEIDLNSVKSKIVNLEDAIEQQGIALDNKLDIIIAEFREKHAENKADLKEMQRGQVDMSQRIAAIEAQLKITKRK